MDSTIPVKGLNLGHALAGGAATLDETVEMPNDWAPLGGSIHLGYLSVVVLTAVLTDVTCDEGTAENVVCTGCEASGFGSVDSVEWYLATGEVCGSGAPRVSDSAKDCVMKELSVFHGGMLLVTIESVVERKKCGSTLPINPNWTYAALLRMTIDTEVKEGSVTSDEAPGSTDVYHMGRLGRSECVRTGCCHSMSRGRLLCMLCLLE